jgi:hypothetical protein
MSSTGKGSKYFDSGQQLSFDSDSFVIGLDQHCSRAISNDYSHFTTFRDIKIIVDGLSGLGKATGKGIIQWFMEDDEAAVHEFEILNCFYIPSTPKVFTSFTTIF